MVIKQVLTDEALGEFIRKLRTHKELKKSFISSLDITSEQQKQYMLKNGHNFYVCLNNDNIPMGFVGVVDNDLKIAVDPEFRDIGVGTFMLKYILTCYNPNIKVRKHNLDGQKFFYKHKLKYVVVD